jgi:hypothetical protein
MNKTLFNTYVHTDVSHYSTFCFCEYSVEYIWGSNWQGRTLQLYWNHSSSQVHGMYWIELLHSRMGSICLQRNIRNAIDSIVYFVFQYMGVIRTGTMIYLGWGGYDILVTNVAMWVHWQAWHLSAGRGWLGRRKMVSEYLGAANIS